MHTIFALYRGKEHMMSKKFTKALAGLVAIGAAGAGLFYWFKKKNNDVVEEEFVDDVEEDEFELDADLEEVAGQREYVSLTPTEEVVAEEAAVEETVVEEAPIEEVNNEEKPAE